MFDGIIRNACDDLDRMPIGTTIGLVLVALVFLAWFRDSDGQVVRLRELDVTFGDPGVAHSRAALDQLRPGGLLK
jgi:hypothetical protein